MELAWMGPAPSYRLLHSLFLPPLPSPSILCLTARKCTSIRGALGSLHQPCRRSWNPGYLTGSGRLAIVSVPAFYGSFGWRIGKETGRSGFACLRNSRSDHGVVGSSWTKDGDVATPANGVETEHGTRTGKRSPHSGGVSNKNAENKAASSRNLKDEDSSRVKVKRIPDKARSKFDAPKRAPNSNSHSYNSRSQAQPSERVQVVSGGEVGSDSKASNGNNHEQPVPGDAKGSKPPRGRNKQYAPEQDLRRQLDMCSKYADVKEALEIYDKFNAEGKGNFNQYNYNIVLYLCSSAASNSLKPQKSGNDRRGSEQQNQTRGPLDELSGKIKSKNNTAAESGVLSEKERSFYMKRGFEVYETMKSQGVPPNEATFTAVARLAVAKEDGDLAFEMVKQMAEAELTPRLRSYAPALYTYCKLKNAKKAFEVDDHMKEAGVALEESELEALLKLSVDLGLEDKVYSLLHRFRTTVRDVSPAVVEVIQQWFTSSAAISAGKSNWDKLPSFETVKSAAESCGGGWHGLGWLGKGSWEVKSSIVDGHGVCQECGEQLVTIDLDPQETEIFAQSLSKIACRREAKNNEFKKFQAWLDRRGPFGAIVDGANVGLYNSNCGKGGFNFYQLNNVVNGIQTKLGIEKEPLILLHHRRTKGGPAAFSFATRILNKWMDANSIYTTPTGSNDDWYWLYAAVRYRCLLVTNDEMRDHLFSLLGNDFFPKWKERHQVRFTINQDGLTFHMPPPYSTVIQESGKGSWHVPKSSKDDDVLRPREWMCVTRVGHAAPSNTKSEEELTVISTSILESSASAVETQTATSLELKEISLSVEEIHSPKPRRSHKSTAESSSSASKPSTVEPLVVEKLEERTTVRKRVSSTTIKSISPRFSPRLHVSEVEKFEKQPTSSKKVPATKKSRSPKSAALQASELEKLEERSTPLKRISSTTKKSRSPKSSTVQSLEVEKLEVQSTPPKIKASATKKSRSTKSSTVQSLEVESLEGQSTLPKRRASATMKSRSPKPSTAQPLEVESLEGQSTPPKRKPSATKKARSPKPSTIQPLEVESLEGQSTPPTRIASATKKSRSTKSSTVQSLEVESLEGQSTLPKRRASTTKKSRSPKPSTVQPLEVESLEGQSTPPKRKPSATKKSRSPNTSVLFQKLEAAETMRSGGSIDFEI